ncbi:YqgE/AlgH family protein [Tanticharoenia sakaeratensis]|jgi:putative transcriptional regulator|uniref:UPF0301 protein Tasa_001_032 n=1 Tax=Tanticharoenia sakaeratensis NBRC 103193 TaxID=1231623 RepID=A0A0D6MGF2_9PROT|nr:YqgE/AlgH family protein [Tanticharoenia sakaeratensis]GAN52717.1 hypothetical protein Tasa_001_032 [Tanticharoenia sakaeratensis NBRC 103193]GBQ24308.1 transcriptional regulator [Tanticharoenia sakaeratensis NBRC 103193]
MPNLTAERGRGLAGTGHDSLTGSLLVASPALAESPFAQSIVYVCAHSVEDGTMGLIVNRRLPQPSLDELMEQLGIEPAPPRRRIGLCLGGPIDHTRGFVLHSSDWSGDGSLSVDDTTMLTASLDVLREIAGGRGPKHALLALGHAMWEAGQLEEEMVRHSAWLNVPATEQLVFGADHAAKWRRALAATGIDPVALPDAVGHA